MNPDVVILPETWNVGFFPRENLDKLSDRDCSRVKETFSSLSKTYAVNVIAGSVANRRQMETFTILPAYLTEREINSAV